MGFIVYHPTYGKVHANAHVPDSIVQLSDRIKELDTYIGQFELWQQSPPSSVSHKTVVPRVASVELWKFGSTTRA
jgi:hypothetical protein